MKTTLYSITETQRYLLQEIEEMEGLLTPEMEEQLTIQAHQIEEKTGAYLEVIADRNGLIQNIDAEIKRLQQMKKVAKNLTERLKYNMLIAVKTFGDYNVGLTKISTRKSQSIEVEDTNSLDAIYKTIKVTETANKIELKKAIKSGLEIEGVELVTNLNLKIN